MPPPARIQLRVLFDELLPWRVASALRVLGLRSSWVGDVETDAPPRGSTDQVVLEHAKKRSQVVVTSNHDMIVLAAEVGVSVVWLDPYGRQLSREETALRALSHIRAWDELFRTGAGPLCVRSLKTKNELMTLDAASDMAMSRMRTIQQRKVRAAKKRRATKPDIQLNLDETD